VTGSPTPAFERVGAPRAFGTCVRALRSACETFRRSRRTRSVIAFLRAERFTIVTLATTLVEGALLPAAHAGSVLPTGGSVASGNAEPCSTIRVLRP